MRLMATSRTGGAEGRWVTEGGEGGGREVAVGHTLFIPSLGFVFCHVEYLVQGRLCRKLNLRRFLHELRRALQRDAARNKEMQHGVAHYTPPHTRQHLVQTSVGFAMSVLCRQRLLLLRAC